jgi:hypothetical protein
MGAVRERDETGARRGSADEAGGHMSGALRSERVGGAVQVRRAANKMKGRRSAPFSSRASGAAPLLLNHLVRRLPAHKVDATPNASSPRRCRSRCRSGDRSNYTGLDARRLLKRLSASSLAISRR